MSKITIAFLVPILLLAIGLGSIVSAESTHLSPRATRADVLRDTQNIASHEHLTLSILYDPDIYMDAFSTIDIVIELKSSGGMSPTQAALSFPVPDELGLVGARVNREQTTGVIPQQIRVEHGEVRWQGNISSEGRLVIVVRARLKFCVGEFNQEINTPVNVLTAGGHQLSAEDTITLKCAAAIGPDELMVKKQIDPSSPVLFFNDRYWVMPGALIRMNFSITNLSGGPIAMAIFDHLSPDEGAACNWDVRRVRFEPEEPAGEGLDFTFQKIIPLTGDIGGNETALLIVDARTIEANFSVVGKAHTEELPCDLSGQLDVHPLRLDTESVTMLADTEASTSPVSQHLSKILDADLWRGIPPISSERLTLALAAPDTGDAPTSHNHSGTVMWAYPSVEANFATVFDPNVGGVPGPWHRNTHGLRLGHLSDRELDADLEPGRNLLPSANRSNLDQYDDGIDPAGISFPTCQRTTIPVRITISPEAVAYFRDQQQNAFLNIWVDGNRDGDWADAITCGQSTPAPEHIVIDYPIDVASFGAGEMTLQVLTTHPVPWPGQPVAGLYWWHAWSRVSLSEAPVPKPLVVGSVRYGDGRGPAGGFAMGETEDYRIRVEELPASNSSNTSVAVIAAEPDLYLKVRGKAEDGQGSDGTQRKWSLRIDYTNQGDAAAVDPVVTIMTAAPFDIDSVTSVTLPHRDNFLIQDGCSQQSQGTCQFVIALPEPITPDEKGSIAVQWVQTCTGENGDGCISTRDFEVELKGIDSGFAADAIQLALPLDPVMITWPLNSTTDSGEFELKGIASPGAQLRIFADGFESGDVSAREDGTWVFPVVLEDGAHVVCAIYASQTPSDCSGPNISMIYVDSALPFSPATMRFDGILAYNGEGRLDAQDWRAMVRAGEEVHVGLFLDHNLCATASVTLEIEGVGIIPLQANDCQTDRESSSQEARAMSGWAEGTFVAPPAGVHDAYLRYHLEGEGSQLYNTTYHGTLISLDLHLQPATFDSSDEIAAIAPSNCLTCICMSVIDTYSGVAVSNASVSIFQRYVDEAGTSQWRLWPGDDFGHPNPQFTGTDGIFQFNPPSRSWYRLYVRRDGYQSFWSRPFRLEGWCKDCMISLTPDGTVSLISPEESGTNHVLVLTDGGISPPFINIQPGDTIAWRNLDLEERAVGNWLPPGVEPGDMDWYSGHIPTGSASLLEFPEAGIFTYQDRSDPLLTGVVRVEKPRVFMPVLLRAR